MKSKREEYAMWFEQRRDPRNRAIEAQILAIASIYDEIQESGDLTEEQLQKIVHGASSPNQLMWDSVSALLRNLGERWPNAGDAIIEMSMSTKSHVRFVALCCLGSRTPGHISDIVIKNELTDKALSVRSKAGEKADLLNKKNLIPDLERALAVESDDRVKKSLELSLRMLRDGYWVKTRPDGQMVITVKHSRGLSSKFIREQELRSKGLDGIIKELRK